MSAETYNTITAVLSIALLVAILVMVTSLIAMLVRWKQPSRRRHVTRMLVSLAVIPCLIATHQAILWLVFLPSLGRQQMAEVNAARAEQLRESSLVFVGDDVPGFSVTTIDGQDISLPSPGNVVLINFFATWCGPCQIELPHIDQIWMQHKDIPEFQLVVIGREETPDAVQQFRDQHGFSFPIAADPQRDIYSLFAEELIPRTLIISPEGKIVYATAGFHEEDLDELNAVLVQQIAAIK